VDNIILNNVHIEKSLTVNSEVPIYDLKLNSAHVENIASVGGNIWEANIHDSVIDNALIDKLVLNVSAEPVTSSKILGYDSNGNVIPVEAVFNIGFPVNAAYIMTNSDGLPVEGVPATEVTPSDNLITANAVWNYSLATNSHINDIDNNVNAVNADVLNRLLHTNSIPSSPNNGDLMLYTGATNQDYTQGGIYIYDSPNTKWNLISASQIEVGTGLHYTQNGFTNILEADTNIFCGNMNQWNNLSADQKNEYTGAAIEEDTLSGAFDIYSETETRTNKIWIDGKPIYRKVFYRDSLPNNAEAYWSAPIANIGLVTDIYGISYSGDLTHPLPYSNPDSTLCIGILYDYDYQHITVRTGTDRSAYEGYITVEYTKTTD
jgi:hypothetical protein